MSHGLTEKDYMFTSKQPPWHGLGTVVSKNLTSFDALKEAKLDWKVVSSKVYAENTMGVSEWFSGASPLKPIPKFMANVREDTNEVLGIVSDRYKIIQNVDAFQFADELINVEGLTDKAVYNTAGSLFGGKKVWMLIELPIERIFDDDIAPYLAVVNTHDGSGALKVFNCATRIVCRNTLHVALKEGRRHISIRHLASAGDRKSEAFIIMNHHSAYFKAMRSFANDVVGIKVDPEKLLKKLFPTPDNDTKEKRDNREETKQEIIQIFKDMDNLQNFQRNGWGFYNAIADWYSNKEPKRFTKTYNENRMNEYLEGVPILEKTKDLLLDLA